MLRRITCLTVTALLLFTNARGEIVSASASHYVLRHEATTAMSPAATWQRLVDPASWWHPDHTYSGDAANLSLDLEAGGLWKEEWPGGSVAHGKVVFVAPGDTLRLEAPFGPLQGIGAWTVWTISLEPIAGGTRVVFDETSIGPPTADLAELAKAVDFVKGEAMRRLTAVERD